MQAQELESDGGELLLIVVAKVVFGALRAWDHYGTVERFARGRRPTRRGEGGAAAD
jgi:hypothetical protein